MKKKEAKGSESKQNSKEEVLTRRKAIKRIAGLFAAAVVTTKVFGQNPEGFQVAYLSKPPYNPYADSVYGSSSGAYRSVQFYNSYRSHYSSVPPPYSSRK